MLTVSENVRISTLASMSRRYPTSCGGVVSGIKLSTSKGVVELISSIRLKFISKTVISVMLMYVVFCETASRG